MIIVLICAAVIHRRFIGTNRPTEPSITTALDDRSRLEAPIELPPDSNPWPSPTPLEAVTPIGDEDSSSHGEEFLNLVEAQKDRIKFKIIPAMRRLYEKDPRALATHRLDERLYLGRDFREFEQQRSAYSFHRDTQYERIGQIMSSIEVYVEDILVPFECKSMAPEPLPQQVYADIRASIEEIEKILSYEKSKIQKENRN